jgi:hypothetical protein
MCGAPTGGVTAVPAAAGPAASPRVVATFNARSTWAGKQVVYRAQRLSVDGAFLSADKLLAYERRAWLDWAHDGLREWLGDLAAWERAALTAPAAGRPAAAPPDSATTPRSPQTEDGPATGGQPPTATTRMDGPASCPYCAVAVEPPPRATQDCLACGRRMNLKRLAGTAERRLLTDDAAADNDAAWRRYHLEVEATGDAPERPAGR